MFNFIKQLYIIDQRNILIFEYNLIIFNVLTRIFYNYLIDNNNNAIIKVMYHSRQLIDACICFLSCPLIQAHYLMSFKNMRQTPRLLSQAVLFDFIVFTPILFFFFLIFNGSEKANKYNHKLQIHIDINMQKDTQLLLFKEQNKNKYVKKMSKTIKKREK